jgi:hypothetical protein
MVEDEEAPVPGRYGLLLCALCARAPMSCRQVRSTQISIANRRALYCLYCELYGRVSIRTRVKYLPITGPAKCWPQAYAPFVHYRQPQLPSSTKTNTLTHLSNMQSLQRNLTTADQAIEIENGKAHPLLDRPRSAKYFELLEARRKLPVSERRQEFLNVYHSGRVSQHFISSVLSSWSRHMLTILGSWCCLATPDRASRPRSPSSFCTTSGRVV